MHSCPRCFVDQGFHERCSWSARRLVCPRLWPHWGKAHYPQTQPCECVIHFAIAYSRGGLATMQCICTIADLESHASILWQTETPFSLIGFKTTRIQPLNMVSLGKVSHWIWFLWARWVIEYGFFGQLQSDYVCPTQLMANLPMHTHAQNRWCPLFIWFCGRRSSRKRVEFQIIRQCRWRQGSVAEDNRGRNRHQRHARQHCH